MPRRIVDLPEPVGPVMTVIEPLDGAKPATAHLGVTDTELCVPDENRCFGTAAGLVCCAAPEAAQLQGSGDPAGVLEGALEHGNKGAGPEAFAPQPKSQAHGLHGVGERRERRPGHHKHPGYALHGAAAGKVHEAAGHVHPGVKDAETQDHPGNRQGGQDRLPQAGCCDRTEEDHMGVRGRQRHRRYVEHNRAIGARPVEKDAVDDPRRDEDGGESRRCA